MSQFVHLHTHSHYSLLDGLSKIPDLIGAASKSGMTALALTDHGALYGAVEFYKAAKREGIKPIIGLEAYVAPENLHSKKGPADTDYFHLLLLSRDLEGYQNLLKLVTISHLEGYYYKPRLDKVTLARLSGGLIALSGCLRGEIARHLLAGNGELAKQQALAYKSIFPRDSFYLEIQRNSEEQNQKTVNLGLIKLSRETGIPLVATNDVHYLEPGDAAAQDILVCIGTGRTVEDSDRLDMRALSLHLKSPEEMAEAFSDIPEAVENTVKIAESVNLELELGKLHFPSFAVPDGNSAEKYFETLCYDGLKARYSDGSPPEEVLTRLRYEIDIIKRKGYVTYLLVIADIVNWARNRGVISTTRGSAAGSLAAYALGITTMNPVEYKLPFERFLNLDRPTPPDIDMDFADNRRDEVLEYVSEKYGKDKVAQIVTFGTMMARAAVRDVGRALGIPYSKCDRIAKMIPFGKQGFHMTIEKAVSLSPELKEAYQKDAETRNLIELAKKVEGCARHASIHAAGVVIAPTKLTDFTPLELDTDNQNIITQYDMHSVEDAGLVKMDFLGIRNLSILGNAVEIVRATKNVEVDLQALPLDDRKTFELLSSGRTMGVFQLGGSGMTKYLVDLRPTNIFDIMAMISLYRPGPMESIPEFIARKHNPRAISYLDPRMKEILDLSYGVITYQDDVLLIAIKLAGYTWEEADKLRKAMGKKIPKEMSAQKEKFIQGAIGGGMPSEKAIKLWSLIEPFAAYGFNKAHAASYAMVAYQTAYMKANYPVEFMAAVLTAESAAADNDKVAAAVAECASLGIQVLPPDVNESLDNFTVINDRPASPQREQGGQIRFGLSAVKNLGSDVIAAVIAERKQNGPFGSITQFVKRAKTRNFNKKSWEAMVKSGSLDRFGERNQLLANAENILEYARQNQRQTAAGQEMLLPGSKTADQEIILRPVTEATEAEKLSWEKELLGLYVSSHPLENHRSLLKRFCVPIKSLGLEHENTSCVLGGIITRVQTILTKKGEQMCFADLEDLGGKLELVVFPNIYSDAKSLVKIDNMVLVRGKISEKDGELKMLADKIVPINNPEALSEPGSVPIYGPESPQIMPINLPVRQAGRQTTNQEKLLKIRIPATASPQVFSKLKTVFAKYPGSTSVSLIIPDREGTPREVKTNFTVANSEEFKTQLKALLRDSIKT